MNAAPSPRPNRLRSPRWILGLVAIVASPFAFGACGSLSKSELKTSLAALGKNASIQALDSLTFTADLGNGEREYELIYHHAARTENVGSGADQAPVVLIHGTPSTLYSWSELIHGAPSTSERPGFTGLAVDRDVFAIELVGHGMAPGEGPVTFELCARFIAESIRALGLERVHLVGSSYGGEFAWRAALNDPDLFESLVLIDSSGVGRRDADWLSEEVAMRDNPLAKIGWMVNSRERIQSALAPHFRVIPPDRVEEFFLVCDNSTNWKAMVDLVRDENGEREVELPDLKTPTLLLWGADDIAYKPDYYAERFAQALPNAELLLMPKTGHYPHEERPAETIKVLQNFFDSPRVQP